LTLEASTACPLSKTIFTYIFTHTWLIMENSTYCCELVAPGPENSSIQGITKSNM